MLRLTFRCACLALLWTAISGVASAQAPVRQQYIIDAQLDPTRHLVRATLELRLHNHTPRPLGELLFHLYLNAFRDDHSVFMRESGGALRGSRASGRGHIVLESLTVDGHDQLASAERELTPGDFTQLRVALREAIAPAAWATIRIAFVSTLPPLFARSGYVDDFYLVAQWFPKLAKLEPDGQFESFPYHGLGEFYADFADYDVTLRVPRTFALGSCGSIYDQQQQGAQRVVRVRAERVHDFAWVASPTLELSQDTLAGVQVTFLAPPGYSAALREHARVVEAGLRHFGKLLGDYPYPTLTVVVPPRGAEGGAGMEYPTLLIADGQWLPNPLAPSLSGGIVTAHELAHQWFYGVLASNEVRYPVLDEGLSEWATLDLMRTLHGPREPRSAWFAVDRFELERLISLRVVRSVAPGLPAPAYAPTEYAPSVYGRAALALESIRRAHGARRFEQAMGSYARAQRFAHPTPRELGQAFDQVYGAGFAERVLFPLLLHGQSSRVSIASARAERSKGRSLVTVRARREGVPLPTWLCAYDGAGRELQRRVFPAAHQVLDASFESERSIAYVAVDCDRALLLDDDVTDQVWRFRAGARSTLLSSLLSAVQLALSWLGP